MIPGRWFPRLWAGWAAASAGGFAWLEWQALRRPDRNPAELDSLTSCLQHLACRSPRARTVTAGGWVVFAAWFLHHTWLSYRYEVQQLTEG